MLFSNRIFVLLGLLFYALCGNSQIIKTPGYEIETGGVVSSDNLAPFWLYSDQFGLILPEKYNGYLKGSIYAPFTDSKSIDYSYGIELVNRYSVENNLYLSQAFLKLKFYRIIVSAGNFNSFYGNQDKTLSSGDLLWSGNVRNFPRVNVEILDFAPVPFTKGYVEYKGGISHGWFGSNDSIKNYWLHHKYFFLQFGGKLPVNVHVGLHHFAQWGGKTRYGKMPSDFDAFKKIFFVQAGDKDDLNADAEWINKLGNHIGSFNVGMDYKTKLYKTGIYWQTIFEDQSGMKFRNLSDGLWGLYFRLSEEKKVVNGLVYEYINTTNQSGTRFMVDSVKVEGNDDYFNNGVYFTGWSYKDLTIGSPFITSPYIMRGSFRDYFRNNKIKAHHFGIEGIWSEVHYKVLYSFVNNYGTNRYPFKDKRNNHSLLIQTTFKEITSLKVDLRLSVGADFGDMYGNKAGIGVSIIKRG